MSAQPNIRMKRLRKDRGWTPEKLAEEAGVSVRTVRDIEAGRVDEPRVGTIFSIAEALGVKVSDIDPEQDQGELVDARGAPA